ncbi:MAG: DnaD domain protein [Bacilli bacterium]|nr:DnaD domain protein [Bacilli bacterium]
MHNLIKDDIISFDKLIIEKYHLLGIDETDTIILIRLNDLLKRGERLLSVERIAPSMKINNEELGQRIVDLVTKGFITIELSLVDAKEIFSLDETYHRLSYLLEADGENNKNDAVNHKIKTTISLLEKELKKILSPLEMEMVNRWYLESDYSDEEIENAILKALKYKNRGVSFIDRSLSSSKKQVENPTPKGENIQELFKKVYVKSK